MHTDGGPPIFTGQTHSGFVDAFYAISRDRDNAVLIPTGTGDEWIAQIDFLLTQQKQTAQEALALGVVSEVLPREDLMPRAGPRRPDRPYPAAHPALHAGGDDPAAQASAAGRSGL